MSLSQRETKQNMCLTDILVLIGLLWFNGGVLCGGRFGYGAAVNMLVFLVSCVFIVFTDSRFFQKLFCGSGFLWGVLFLGTMVVGIVKSDTLPPEVWEIVYALMILVYAVYLIDRSGKVKKIIVYTLLIDRLLVTFNTFVILEIDPDASRYLASSSEALVEQGLSAYMVADFMFIYSTVIILTFIFFKRKELFNGIGILEKIFLWVYTIASVLLVIRASYTTAILVLAGMFVLSFVFTGKNGLWSAVKLAVLLVVIYFSLTFILEWAMETVFKDTTVEQRLQEVLNLLKGNTDEASDAMSRIKRFGMSLETFFKNPLLGVFELKRGTDTALGMHSEWVDGLGMFGILRYPIFIAFNVKAVKFLMRGVYNKRGLIWVYICVFILGVLNPIVSQHMYVMLFIIAPLLGTANSRDDEIGYTDR